MCTSLADMESLNQSMLNDRWAVQNHHYKRSGIVRKDELSVNLERWDAVRLLYVPVVH